MHPTAPHPTAPRLPLAARPPPSSPAAAATLCSMRCCPTSFFTQSHPHIPIIPNPRGGLPAMPRICTVSARVGARRKTCRSMMMVLCLCAVGGKGNEAGRRVSPPALFDVRPPHQQAVKGRAVRCMHEQEQRRMRCGAKYPLMRMRLERGGPHTPAIPGSTSPLDLDIAATQRMLGLACPHLWGIYR